MPIASRSVLTEMVKHLAISSWVAGKFAGLWSKTSAPTAARCVVSYAGAGRSLKERSMHLIIGNVPAFKPRLGPEGEATPIPVAAVDNFAPGVVEDRVKQALVPYVCLQGLALGVRHLEAVRRLGES